MKALLLAVSVLASSCLSWPRDGAAPTPQRPTVASDTSTTAVETFELEAGAALFDGGNASVPVALKYGVSETTEVFAAWLPLVHVDAVRRDESGIGDLSLGVRRRLVDETDELPSIAVQTVVKLPTADENESLGSGETDFLLAGILTRTVEAWTLTGFAQLDLLGDPGGGVLVGQSLAIGASRPLPDRFGVFGEVAGLFVPENDSDQLFTTVGLTYNPYRDRVFDVGFVVGLNEEAPDFGIVLGFTQNVGPLARRRTP